MHKKLFLSTLILGVLFSCSIQAMNRPESHMQDSTYTYDLSYKHYDEDTNAWIIDLEWEDSHGNIRRQEGQLCDNKMVFGLSDDDEDEEIYRMRDSAQKRYYFMPYTQPHIVKTRMRRWDCAPSQNVKSGLLPLPAGYGEKEEQEKKLGVTFIIQYEDPDCPVLLLPWCTMKDPLQTKPKMKKIVITI